MNIPAETCEGGSGAAKPFAVDIADQYITADTPEVVISQEASSSFPHTNIQTPPADTIMNVECFIFSSSWISQNSQVSWNSLVLDFCLVLSHWKLGYAVLHRHRCSSTDRHGGGASLTHFESISAMTTDMLCVMLW